MRLAPEMQHADEGEEAAGGGVIHLGLAVEPFLEDACALVVDAAAGHVDGLDLGWGQAFDRVEIALADLDVILHHLAERGEREVELGLRLGRRAADREDKALVADCQIEVKRPGCDIASLARGQGKAVLFEQIENRNAALLLDLRRGRREICVIERDVCQAGHAAPEGNDLHSE